MEWGDDVSRQGKRWALSMYPGTGMMTLAFFNPATREVRGFRTLSKSDALDLAAAIREVYGVSDDS